MHFTALILVAAISAALAVAAPQNSVVTSETTPDGEGGVQVDVRVAVNGLRMSGGQSMAPDEASTLPSPSSFVATRQMAAPAPIVVTLYDNSGFSGDSTTLSMNRRECTNFGNNWRDKPSSIRSPVCVEFFRHADCTSGSGDSRTEKIGPENSSGESLKLNNDLRSARLC